MQSSRVLKQGYLRKLKTMKRKYFVLKADSAESSARLEYYDSEKKWRAQTPAKRVIPLKSCFNIQRRLDTKHRHLIALYTKEDCLCLLPADEAELAAWLGALLALHLGEDSGDAPQPRQHVWQVNVQKKGLGASMTILGLYHLCLTDKTVTLVKIRANSTAPIPYDARANDTMEFSLASIRRCGDSECFFYMELGRSAVTGAGELWMHTEDPNIAKSMHATILHAMSSLSGNKDEFGPERRTRSSSANEASKPLSVLTRRQTHSGTKPHGLSPSNEPGESCSTAGCVGACLGTFAASASYGAPANASASAADAVGVRERCDSLPSRQCIQDGVTISMMPPIFSAPRPYSFDAGRGLSRSPPMFDKTHHPFDGASTESIGSSASADEVDCSALGERSAAHSLARSIPEEGRDADADGDVSAYMEMSAPAASLDRMLRSTKIGSAERSRTSSLADEGPAGDARPAADDGYVEMDRAKREAARAARVPPRPSPAASLAGAPSPDSRFSEFRLDKVSSYFAPEDEDGGRPARAYSVGSRPEGGAGDGPARSLALENRARAFSTGSRGRAPPRAVAPRFDAAAARSAASLASPPAGPGAPPRRRTRSSSRGSAEPLDDLMELDFSIRADDALSRSPSSRGARLALPLSLSGEDFRDGPSTDGYLEMSPGGCDSSRRMRRDSDRGSTEARPIPVVGRSADSPAASISPISSPSDSFPNRRRSSKKQRRNSKESAPPLGCQQTIFPFVLDDAGSPTKPRDAKAPSDPTNRKCAVDASGGTLRLADDRGREVSSPTDAALGRLSTVREINEPTLNGKIDVESQKSIKQMLNNATRASARNDYANVERATPERGVAPPDDDAGDYAVMDPSAIRGVAVAAAAAGGGGARPDPAVAPKSRTVARRSAEEERRRPAAAAAAAAATAAGRPRPPACEAEAPAGAEQRSPRPAEAPGRRPAALHYATLDLEAGGPRPEAAPGPPPPPSPSPSAPRPAFAYATIDFLRSEELRAAEPPRPDDLRPDDPLAA